MLKTQRYNVFISLICFMILVIYGCGRPNATYQAGPPEVSVIKITSEQVVLTTELPGRVSAYRIAEVRPQVSGIIQKRFFYRRHKCKGRRSLISDRSCPV